MSTINCKTCRRANQKLFLKGDKCFSPKCPVSRKPYAPGKKSKRPKRLSDYGLQLKEKQKLKFLYGMREKPFLNYVKKAMARGGTNIGLRLTEMLESRLDNVVYKLGFAGSRSAAKQIVSHGHIYVNGKKTNIPSRQLKKGDKIAIRQQSLSKKNFEDLDINFKKYNPPSWLKLDKAKREGEIVTTPSLEAKSDLGINLNSVIEFYSR